MFHICHVFRNKDFTLHLFTVTKYRYVLLYSYLRNKKILSKRNSFIENKILKLINNYTQ